MNTWIALFVMAVVLAAFFRVRREKKKSYHRIRELKKITNLRIEEARIQSALEVSGRIGQDIHDEFSASLAGIVRRMELLGMETRDEHIKEDIYALKTEATKVYNSVRDKSHFLYSGTTPYSPSSLDKSIKSIAHFHLPHHLYRTEIDIEPKAAEALSPAQCQEILKILQEAATNILKHAHKATEVFVFLYLAENGTVVFQIGDNGHTFKKPKEGVGLQSMRKRVYDLKGTFTLETGGGTVITIQFPKAALKEAMLTA